MGENGESERRPFDPDAPAPAAPAPGTGVLRWDAGPAEPGAPDRLRVVVSRREEVPASHADLYVEVRVAAGVAAAAADGGAAGRLTAYLRGRKLDVPSVELQAVRAEPGRGWLGRRAASSSSIRLRRVPVESLGAVLEALATRPGTRIRALLWEYADGDEARDAWVEAGLRRARDRAGRMASALGVRLLGVHDVEARCLDHDAPEPGAAEAPRHGVLANAEYDLGQLVGLDLRHTKTVEVRVAVAFRVSGFEPG